MSERLESLDVFRGLTIAAMILVSSPGDWNAVYEPLQHAAWHGWTPTDLIFPFLLFAMGAAVPFAMSRRRAAGPRVRRHVLRRGLLLFAAGLVLNAIEAPVPLAWSTFRIPGVLQRIAIVYVAVAWLIDRTSERTQAIVAVTLLVGYWLAMTFVPVPGFGAGLLSEPGNLASYIDVRLLHGHMERMTGDPEGLLSTLPAISTALFGVFSGRWLIRPGTPYRHASLWIAGLAATIAGLIWDRVFPINKHLWTSSFVLLSAGSAAQLLAVCHWLLDVKRWRGWELPLVAFGRNPLAAYFLSVALDSILTRWSIATPSGTMALKTWLYEHAFATWAAPCCGAAAASFFYALAYVVSWGAVVTVMYRRRIFVGI